MGTAPPKLLSWSQVGLIALAGSIQARWETIGGFRDDVNRSLRRRRQKLVEQLDPSVLTRQCGGRGSAAHHPSVLLGLLVSG
jgi:hypothetical protein